MHGFFRVSSAHKSSAWSGNISNISLIRLSCNLWIKMSFYLSLMRQGNQLVLRNQQHWYVIRSVFTFCDLKEKNQQLTDVETQKKRAGSRTASDWLCAWNRGQKGKEQRKHAGGGREGGMAAYRRVNLCRARHSRGRNEGFCTSTSLSVKEGLLRQDIHSVHLKNHHFNLLDLIDLAKWYLQVVLDLFPVR